MSVVPMSDPRVAAIPLRECGEHPVDIRARGGMRLQFVEGYRPLVLQRRYFEKYAQKLSRSNPQWSATRIREAASRYVSPPEIAPQGPARPSTSPSSTAKGTRWTWAHG
jgi:D-alanyl-D-alanine dipeptidase